MEYLHRSQSSSVQGEKLACQDLFDGLVSCFDAINAEKKAKTVVFEQAKTVGLDVDEKIKGLVFRKLLQLGLPDNVIKSRLQRPRQDLKLKGFSHTPTQSQNITVTVADVKQSILILCIIFSQDAILPSDSVPNSPT